MDFSNKSPPPVNEQIMDFSVAATQQQPTITPENTTIKGQKRTWTRRQAKLAGASSSMGPPKAEIQERSKRVRQEEANMEVDIHQIFCQPFCIEIEFSLKANTHRSWFVFVYLSPCRATRVLNVFRSASDHNLLFLHTGITQNRRKKAFCFDKRWLKQPRIKEEIQNVWAQPVTGSAMFTLSEKIKATRQIWRLITKPGLLMSRVLRHRYFPNGDFFGAKPTQSASWLWRTWLKLQKTFLQGFIMKVSNGRKTKIWEHPWVPELTTRKLLVKTTTSPNLTWVSELIAADGISWNTTLIRNSFPHHESESILKIKSLSNHLPDKPI
ncbi:RNA-directed DNA polymerase (reversetranscriptase)-related family protein, partial [Striga asiatica]